MENRLVKIRTFQGYTVSVVDQAVNAFTDELFKKGSIVLDVKTDIITVKDMVYYTRMVVYAEVK